MGPGRILFLNSSITLFCTWFWWGNAGAAAATFKIMLAILSCYGMLL